MDLIRIVPDLFYGFMGFGLALIWNLILFNIGTLLQKNKDFLNYLNIKSNDTINHLVDSSSNIGLNAAAVLSTIGMLLKIYAIGDTVYEFLKLGRYIF